MTTLKLLLHAVLTATIGIIVTVTVDGAPLKVIGAGLGRTGTDSLREALNDLDFGPTYHMYEVLGIPGRTTGAAFERNHVDLWPIYAEHDGETKDHTWDDLFAGYESAVDQLSMAFAVQLAQKYPDAKVILTVRSSAEKWHGSIASAWCRFSKGGMTQWLDEAVYDFRGNSYFALFSTFERRFRHQNAAMDGLFARTLDLSTFSTSRICLDRNYAVKYYNIWNDYIKTNIDPDRLLVLETGNPDTAQQLGDFLGLDEATIADFTYPHVNSAKSFKFVLFINKLEAALTVIGPMLLLLLVKKLHRRVFRGGEEEKQKKKD